MAKAANPADLASRSTTPQQLLDADLWWKGSPWLVLHPDKWLSPSTPITCSDIPELRPVTLLTIQQPTLNWKKFSSWPKMVRAIARCLRLAHGNRLVLSEQTTVGTPLVGIQKTLLNLAQQESFPKLLNQLQNNSRLVVKGNIASLHPYIDEAGIIRIGGRLRRLRSHPTRAYPVLLHQKSHLTRLLVKHVHDGNVHPGPATLFILLASKYYVIGVKNIAKLISRSCVACQKAYCEPTIRLLVYYLQKGLHPHLHSRQLV